MNISDTINIILSVLSFVLALISVVTVIITLRQNGKMIKNNEDQIAEMRNEHRMSLQPVLYFSNPKYCFETFLYTAYERILNSFKMPFFC